MPVDLERDVVFLLELRLDSFPGGQRHEAIRGGSGGSLCKDGRQLAELFDLR
jgi:hypothetical protein